MPRQEFDKKTRAAIVLRSKNNEGQICCEGCGLVLGFKSWEIDHTIPEGLRDQTAKRKLTADDGKLLGRCCHKPKTKADIGKIRKADRQKNRHSGVKTASGKLKGRGFNKDSKTPAIDKSALPPLQRRPLYEQKGI